MHIIFIFLGKIIIKNINLSSAELAESVLKIIMYKIKQYYNNINNDNNKSIINIINNEMRLLRTHILVLPVHVPGEPDRTWDAIRRVPREFLLARVCWEPEHMGTLVVWHGWFSVGHARDSALTYSWDSGALHTVAPSYR